MRAYTFLWAGAACAALLAGPAEVAAQGQSRIGAATPAERPPETFNGLQYVDSQGCVFMRAGRGDVVNWVPRVTRARQPLCGYTPTQFSDARPASQAVPVAQAAPAGITVRPEVSTQAVRPTAVMSVAAPRGGVPAVTVAPRIATAPVRLDPCTASVASARLLVGCGGAQAETITAASLVIPAQTRNSTHGASRIGNATAPTPVVSPPGSATYSFKPTPQTDTVVSGTPATLSRLSLATQRIAVPKGYKEAWDDGRLNVFRGLGTAQGRDQMRRSWTETVPQRLVPALR